MLTTHIGLAGSWWCWVAVLACGPEEALPRGQGFWPAFLWQELHCELARGILMSENLLLTGLEPQMSLSNRATKVSQGLAGRILSEMKIFLSLQTTLKRGAVEELSKITWSSHLEICT